MRIKICGVYTITNKVNNEFYVGASVDIKGMYSIHMNRHVRKFKEINKFYNDIFYHGKENFELNILKECEREDLLKFEQYYYDELKPSYNRVRPAKNNFEHPYVLNLAIKNSHTDEIMKNRKELFATDEYKHLFRKEIHKDKMSSVDLIINDKVVKTFDSIRDAGRWIQETTAFFSKKCTI